MSSYWLRATLPRRWRAWLLLGLLVGLLGGGVLTALAGARRGETAAERFLVDTDAWDVAGSVTCDGAAPPDGVEAGDLVGPQRESGGPGGPTAACLERFRALASVADLTAVNQYGAQFAPVDGLDVQPTGDPCYSGPGAVTVAGDPSGRFGTGINRFKIVEGRAADPAAADEVVISRETARRLGLRPGDGLETTLVSYDHCLDDPAGWPEPLSLRIVGIAVGSYEVRPSSGFFINFVTTTPAFVDTVGTDALDSTFVLVRLRSGDENAVPAFLAEVERAGMSMESQLLQAEHHADLQRAVRPSVQALRILAALAGLAGVAVLGQLLIRQTSLETIDLHVLRALGSSRRARFAAAVAWSVPVAVVAASTAVLVAILGSWWTPIGVAHVVEPDPGLSVDTAVLGLGAAVVAAATLLAAGLSAIRPAGAGSPVAQGAGQARPSRLVARLARASFPPDAITGVRMALEPGRGRTRSPSGAACWPSWPAWSP